MNAVDELIENQQKIIKLAKASPNYKRLSTYHVTSIEDEGSLHSVFVTVVRYENEVVFYTNADRFREIVKLYLDNLKISFGSGAHPIGGLDPVVMSKVLKEVFYYVHDEMIRAKNVKMSKHIGK